MTFGKGGLFFDEFVIFEYEGWNFYKDIIVKVALVHF